MKVINIIVEDGLHAKFKSKVYEDGLTMKSKLLSLIYDYTEDKPKKIPKKKKKS